MSENEEKEEVIQREPSDELWYAGGAGGGIIRDCPHGKTFFSDEADFYEEGEYEELIAKQKAEPDKYFELSGDAHSTYLFGKEYVWECSECKKELVIKEDAIWNNRRVISQYLNERLEIEAKQASEDQRKLSVNGIK